MRVLDYAEHALSAPAATPSPRRTSSALSPLVGETEVLWGIGLDANIVTASLKAVISAVNRVGGAPIRRARIRWSDPGRSGSSSPVPTKP